MFCSVLNINILWLCRNQQMPRWSKMQHIQGRLRGCKKFLRKCLGSWLQGGSRHRRLFPALVLSRWKSQWSSCSARSSKTSGGVRVCQWDYLLLRNYFPFGIICVVFMKAKYSTCLYFMHAVHFPTFLLTIKDPVKVLRTNTCCKRFTANNLVRGCCYWACYSSSIMQQTWFLPWL